MFRNPGSVRPPRQHDPKPLPRRRQPIGARRPTPADSTRHSTRSCHCLLAQSVQNRMAGGRHPVKSARNLSQSPYCAPLHHPAQTGPPPSAPGASASVRPHPAARRGIPHATASEASAKSRDAAPSPTPDDGRAGSPRRSGPSPRPSRPDDALRPTARSSKSETTFAHAIRHALTLATRAQSDGRRRRDTIRAWAALAIRRKGSKAKRWPRHYRETGAHRIP